MNIDQSLRAQLSGRVEEVIDAFSEEELVIVWQRASQQTTTGNSEAIAKRFAHELSVQAWQVILDDLVRNGQAQALTDADGTLRYRPIS